MKVLIIYAHPNPMSFTKAVLDNFVKGLKEVGHQYEVVDLYKIKFNPVLQDKDSVTSCKIIAEKVAKQAEKIIRQKGVGF